MTHLENRSYSGDPDTFRARCTGTHSVEWAADVYRWGAGGTQELVAADIPLVRGTLTLDSGDVYRRRLRMEVGGGESWAPTDADSPMVPFGQWLKLRCRINGADGEWLPWLAQGWFWITTHVFERPSLITTVEAVDFSGAVDEYLHTSRRSYDGMTVKGALSAMVKAALPESNRWDNPTVLAPDSLARTKVKYTADVGTGRWSTALDLASRYHVEPYFDADGELVIRKEITDDDDVVGAGGNSPGIGTVANPVATFSDGLGGTLLALTGTLTRDKACNGVVLHVSHVKTKRDTKATDKRYPGHATIWARETDVAAVRWGDRFGRLPIVRAFHTKAFLTDKVLSDYQGRANTLLRRRRGLVRYLDLDVAPMYWVEPDDRVRVEWHRDDGTQLAENHFVQRVDFPLEGGAMRVRTRQLSVVDPGAGTTGVFL